MKLAPSGCTEAEVLRVLKDKAVLVQGCWVASSCLRYVYPMTVMRDFILYLFHKNRVVLHEQLEELNASKEVLREIMLSIAVQRGAVGWEFQVIIEINFIFLWASGLTLDRNGKYLVVNARQVSIRTP